MTELDPATEQRLADLSAEDFDALCARVRPPHEATNPKVRAANALRAQRGLDRTTAATKEDAAAALRRRSGRLTATETEN